MIWIAIAFRNIKKNGRRSSFTILAIGVAYAAINIFGGFQSYMFQGLQDALIYAQGEGHLGIFRKGVQPFYNEIDPDRYLISDVDKQAAKKILEQYPDVIQVSSQLQISGLLSNGDVSTIFVGAGRVPSHMERIRSHARGMIGRISLYTGNPLDDNFSYGVGLSSGLAGKLNVTIGSDVILMGPTVDGQINALDAKVLQLFESPSAPMNDKLMIIPLSLAQSLYNTTGVDRMVVLLKHTEDSQLFKKKFNEIFSEQGLDIEVRTWVEIAPFYTKVKNMFRVIFMFLFVIVLIIVVMSIINTMSMSVMERIREIGTIRSLGIKRRGILMLFTIESILLGLFGSFLGIVLTLTGWLLVKLAEPTWIPPHITKRVPIEVYIVPEYMLLAGMFLISLSLLAALLPTRKAVKMNIVDALGHV